jgi:Fic/DOC family
MPRRGLGPVEGDIALPEGIHLASATRTMLESLALQAPGRLTSDEIESWLDHLCAHDGEQLLNSMRDLARRIAPLLRVVKGIDRFDRLIAAALATGDVRDVTTPALRARAHGSAFDAIRSTRFESFAAQLHSAAPRSVPDARDDIARRSLLPFFEAYFSNFIEGTEFTVNEAARIVFDNDIPSDRPADGHDIAGTYAVVTDPTQRSLIANDPDTFLDLLRNRHAQVMAGRPDKRPGGFKHIANRAGSTEFVAPELVVGTLRRAFEIGTRLVDPFQRAAYIMFVVAEVHPFLDGNGRLARIMMNAELSAGAQVRLIIPTVFRLNYLAALKAATHNDVFSPIIAVLDFAQRYTARIDFTTMATAEADLTRTNAMRDPYEAEQAGVRLVLPENVSQVD